MVYGYGGWTKNFSLANMSDLSQKVAIVTGSNSGVGKETARQLALHGAQVTLACRNAEKAEAAAKEIQQALDSKNPPSDEGEPSGGPKFPGGSVKAAGNIDLSDISAVQRFAADFARDNERLDILVCNAGVVPPKFTKATKPQAELAWVTGHLSHMYLIDQLMPLMQNTTKIQEKNGGKADVRIVMVSADVTGYMDNGLITPLKVSEKTVFDDLNNAETSYGPKAYIRTKLCNVLFTRKLAALLGDNSGIRINAIHPGVVNTEIFHSRSHDESRKDEKPGIGEKLTRKVFESGMISMPVPKGAWNSLYAAAAPEVAEKKYNGEYFFPWGSLRTQDLCKGAQDQTLVERLWEMSTQMLRETTGNQDAVKNLDVLAQNAQGKMPQEQQAS